MNDPTEVQELLAQAGPQQPSTPDSVDTTAPSVANLLANNSKQVQPPAKPAVQPTPAAPPSTLDASLSKGIGNLGQRFADALKAPANGVPLSFGGTMVKAAVDAMASGPRAPSAAPSAAGSTPWDAAQTPEQTPAAGAAPGSLGGVRGAISKLLGGVAGGLDSMGDIAGGIRMEGKGGALGGFAGTAEAHANRMSENALKKQQIATSNAQMLHEQALTHKMGEDAIMDSVKDGRAAYDNVMNPGVGGVTATPLAQDVTASKLTQMINSGELKPTEETVYLTGRTPTGKKDANGQPVMESTYSVVKLAGDIKISPKNAELMNENLGTKYSVDPENPMILPAAQFNAQLQRAMSTKIAMKALAVKDAEGNKVLMDDATRRAALSVDSIPLVQRLTNQLSNPTNTANPNSLVPDPYTSVKVYNAIMGDPKLKNDPSLPPNFAQVWIESRGGQANWDKEVDKYDALQNKLQETTKSVLSDFTNDPVKAMEHAPDVLAVAKSILADPNATQGDKDTARQAAAMATNAMAIEKSGEFDKAYTRAQAEAKAKADALTADNPKGLVGQAFIDSLPAPRAALMNNFIAGNVAMTDTMMARSAGIQLATDLFTAFPNGFDTTKAKEYPKLRQDFQSGPVSRQLNAANTAMRHFGTSYGAAFNTNDPATAGLIGRARSAANDNPSGRTLDNAALALSDEMGKLYSGGVVSDAQQKEWSDKLNPYQPGMTVDKLRQNFRDFIELLGGKLETFQEQWDNGVPSKEIQAPMKIAYPENVKLYKDVTGEDLNVHDVQTIQARSHEDTPPVGTTRIAPGQNGKPTLYLVGGVWVNLAGQRVKP